MIQSSKKILLIICACISLALGIAGIFLPLLPTTPFLLLTSYCFLKSSKRLYSWLIHHKIFGSYIYNYLTHKSIPVKTKIMAVVVLWLSITISILTVQHTIATIVLIGIACAVSWHIITIRTLKKNALTRNESQNAEKGL